MKKLFFAGLAIAAILFLIKRGETPRAATPNQPTDTLATSAEVVLSQTVEGPDTSEIGSNEWLLHRMSSGDTVPVPAGIYSERVATCTRLPEAAASIDPATGKLVWEDGLACTTHESPVLAQNLAFLAVDLATCGDIRRAYEADGIDWTEHSDGAYFAADCEDKGEGYRLHAAWYFSEGRYLLHYDGQAWRPLKSLAEIERVV